MAEESNLQTEDEVCIVYFTKTGQTQRFVEKVQRKTDILFRQMEEGMKVNQRFILLTPTYMFGEVPKEVDAFLRNNHSRMIAVMASGNRNWGGNFAKAGDIISTDYKVQLIGKYELAGTEADVDRLIEFIGSWR